MSDLDAAALRVHQYLGHIDYLACSHRCECGRFTRFVHPISDKSRRRLARDMARAALGLGETP